MARLFIAIELPDEVKRRLVSMRSDIPGAKWVPQNQLHITLAFLGNVEQENADRLTKELSNIRLPSIDLSFAGAGCFPDRRRPRVLWIGVENEPRLISLASEVRSAALSCDISQEERPFSPHITLARLKQPAADEVTNFLESFRKNGKIPGFAAREFILFESRTLPSGAIHTPLRKLLLV